MIQGVTATNIGFYGPQGRALRISPLDSTFISQLERFRFRESNIRITNLEMETSGIYGLAKLLGHQAVSLNAILANRATGTFSQNPEKVMEGLIQYTLDCLFPEHFNLPWHLAIEEGLFQKEGIRLEWIDFPDGTGAMNKALRNGTIDMAVILTGGIIKDIANGNPSKIVQMYVSSPLLWGVHVAAKSSFTAIDQLENARVAISRYGSGSHVMAYAQAEKRGWNPSQLQCEVVGTLEAAVEALTDEKADYFMWEHFTTKPLRPYRPF